MEGGALIAIAFFFGLAAGVVGKIKGSSFFVWFIVGLCLPGIGLIAAILYRFENQEPRRRCPRCGSVRPSRTRSAPCAERTWTGPSQTRSFRHPARLTEA